jgi:LCP family protein required for cell wall assembly
MTDPAQAQHPPAGPRQVPRLTATRKARRNRLRLLVLTITSALTLVAATGAWALTSYVSGSLGRVDAGTTGTPSSGPVNILVAGIDTRSGLTRKEEIELHVGNDVGLNSDTLMLVHIAASHDSVRVVSLPRDSWVSIPGHGMNKINAALGFGGPALMVRTVEQATGLVVNDYVEVDFLAFVKVIDALGGVNICLPFAIHDSYTGLHLSAGEHHVDGVTALKFARDRHSFALSDLTRIKDQQQLLSSMLAEATDSGVLANPFRLQSFLSSVTAAFTVDKGFNVIRLADEVRGIRSQNITFTTVPLASLNYVTPTGQSAVLWDKPAATALFAQLRNDTQPARHAGRASHRRSGSKRPSSRAQVSVDVFNGTLISGLSASTGRELTGLGFGLHRAGLNWPHHHVAKTVIQYPPAQAADARLLHAVLPGASLEAVPGLARIRLILGTAGHAVTGGRPAATTTGTAATTAVPVQQRTAAQDACR